MSSDDIIKNKKREGKDYSEYNKPYIPEYKKRGIKPEPFLPEEVPENDDGSYEEADDFFSRMEGSDIIDNNDYIEIPNTASIPQSVETKPKPSNKKEDDNIKIGEYLLLVCGKLVASGKMETLEKLIANIFYGDHPDFQNMDLSLEEDFVVLKRVNVRLGVLIEE